MMNDSQHEQANAYATEMIEEIWPTFEDIYLEYQRVGLPDRQTWNYILLTLANRMFKHYDDGERTTTDKSLLVESSFQDAINAMQLTRLFTEAAQEQREKKQDNGSNDTSGDGQSDVSDSAGDIS